MTISAVVRRTVIRGAVASAIFASTLAAQSSQIAVVEAHPLLSRGLEGFELRERSGFGTFISDSVLRASEHLRLVTLLQQHIPSLVITRNGVAGEFPVSSRVCNGGMACSAPRCYMRIILDGTLLFDGTPQLRDAQGVDLGHLRPQDFSGVEFHASSASLPAQFGGPNADCGTLLFWSRET